MNIKTIFTLFLSYFLFANQALAESTYLLKEGDTLSISVWGEATMKKDAIVLPDGSVTYPLAGRIDVVNASVNEVERRITEKLKTYLPDPQVTVVVSSIKGNRIFILGKVKKPGPVQMTGPMTVIQALSLAGGFDKFADLDDIKVLRNNNGEQTALPVNYNQLIKGKNLKSNLLLNAGDTILIP